MKSSVVALRGPRVPLSPRARPLIELNQPPHGAVETVMKRRRRLGLRLAGAGLLAATGAIHLDLYLTGYRTIPTIGWLFLLQVIAAFCLSAAVLMTGSRLAAAAGAGFALSTLGGYLLSAWIGLFGFTEVRTTAGITAGSIEVAAFAALAVLAAVPAAPDHRAGRAAARSPLPARMQAGGPRRRPDRRRALHCCPGAAGHHRRQGWRPGSGGSGCGHQPEGREDPRRDGPDQRQGLHAVLVRP